MIERNIEIDELSALRILAKFMVIKMLWNGVAMDVTRESVLQLLKRSSQIGFNASGNAYNVGLALWIRNGETVAYFETSQSDVDQLASSMRSLEA